MKTVQQFVAAFLLLFSATGASFAQAPPSYVLSSGRAPTINFGGLLQLQGEFGDKGDSRFSNANDRFYLRRARLNAAGKFLEEFDFKLELDLAGSIGNTSGLRAQLTDAYINWNRYAAANVKVGQFKTPFGFEQLYADPKLPTIERSLANDRLTLSRQIGIQGSGDFLDKRASWALGAFNGTGANNNFNDNDDFLTVGRLSGRPWRGRLFGEEALLSVGAAAYSSSDVALNLADLGFDSTPATADKDALFTGDRRGSAFDAEFTTGRFEVWVEVIQGHFEPKNALPVGLVEAEGWSSMISAFVVPKRLQALIRRESFDPSTAVDENSTRITTLGLNWFLKSDDLKVVVDYMRVAIDRRADENRFLARLQVIF
ncbi:MAG: porin [Thermoanaerobaculia bacterium]